MTAQVQKLLDDGPVREFVRQRLRNKTAIFVDGPNILVKHGLDLAKLADRFGDKVSFKTCYLSREVPDPLIKAVENCGFSPFLCFGNIHIYMGMDAIDLAHDEQIHRMIFVSRDSALAPVVRKIRDKGIEAIVVGFNPGMSVALRNAATKTILVDP